MRPPKTKAVKGRKEQQHCREADLTARPQNDYAWKAGACLAAVVVALYWRVLANQFINFDDGSYILLNDHVKSGLTFDGLRWAFTEFSNANWHPLTWLSHMLDVELFGLNAGPHHLANVLWHAMNASVLLVALWQMTGCLWRSAIVAALFALHPLRVESVAWASERKDVLSSFFYICTLWAYAWYAQRPQSWRRYVTVGVILSLGLMAKPSVVTAPCLMLLLDYWPLARKERLTVLLREKLPFFALAAGLSLATFIAQKQGGAMTAIQNLGLSERLANAVVSYVRYLGKIFWPNPLAVLYPYQRNLSALTVVACLLLLAAITALALWLGRRRRYLPVGWFWFLGTMVPMIGIVQVGWQGYADRYSYIPSIGIFVAVVWLAADVAESRRWQREALVSTAAVLVALALITWSQLPYWHDDLTLFQHALAVTSANPAAEYHLAGDLVDLGRNREAIPHLEEMIRLQPDYYAAYYMLGKAQAAEGDNEPALQNFSEALRLNPDYVEAYYARAMMFFKTGNQLAAERDFREALKRGLGAEWAADAHNALGAIAGQQGNLQTALAEFEQAVGLRPTLLVAQQNLANALVAAGRIREAVTQLEQALSATHGDASIRKMLDDLRARS
jgi:tetratricopeptide (TPR) repeat protein